MENKNEVLIASFEHVRIWRLGESGREDFEPATLKMFTVKDRDMKCHGVARNLAGNALIFNAIVPGNLCIKAYDNDISVTVAKIPSSTYVSRDGKPIPTIWNFKFLSSDLLENFLDYFYRYPNWQGQSITLKNQRKKS